MENKQITLWCVYDLIGEQRSTQASWRGVCSSEPSVSGKHRSVSFVEGRVSVNQANQKRSFTDKSIAIFLSTSVIIAKFVKGPSRTASTPSLKRNMGPSPCLVSYFGEVGWALRCLKRSKPISIKPGVG